MVVDQLTKYAHFIALAHPYNAKEVAKLFLKEMVKLHDFSETIVSYRDRVFMSSFWTKLFKLVGTKLKFSFAYHPQTDGQTEVVNRCLETYLRCMTGAKPRQSHRWVSWAEYWFNTNYHEVTRMTPFKAMYGRDPPPVIRGDVATISVDEVAGMIQDRNKMLDILKDHLVQDQNRMKQQADKSRRGVEYKVGEMVYLKIQPYKLKKLAKRINQKLSPTYYGSYEIVEKIGKVVYRLKLPEDSKVHPVFYVSLLKPTMTVEVVVQPLPPYVTKEIELQLEDVLAMRGDSKQSLEVLVKWKNMLNCENSWESLSKMIEAFPDLHLEDKMNFKEGGFDMGGILGRHKRFMKERSGNQLHGDHKPTHVDSDTNRIAYMASRRRREIFGFGRQREGGFRGGGLVGFWQGEPDTEKAGP